MNKKQAYEIKTDKIYTNKMQLSVVNKHPKQTNDNKNIIKSEIEKELYKVFKKYA